MVRNWYGSKWIRPEKRLAIYLRDNFICGYCGKDLRNVRKPKFRTLDHVIPSTLTSKPDNTADNLITCCKACNDRKNARNVLDFLKGDTTKLDRLFAQLAKPIDVQAAKLILKGE
jgi:5-methylcytosine-specific restriction endonuclease McrA